MSHSTQPLRLGIIGLGMVAGVHGRALADLAERVEVRAVFARDSARRNAYAAEFGFPAVDSAETLLSDPTIDAVLILTPPNARISYVEAAAKAGKHVLLEKPIERDGAAAEQIVEICARAGVTLGVVLQHRFRASSMALRAMIDSGELGAVSSVQVVVPWWRTQSYYDQPGRGTYERDGGGVLISQAIHTLDLMLSLVGSPQEVQAVVGTTRLHHMEGEDFVGAGLRFRNGALGSLMATTSAFPGAAEYIAIDFEHAAARLQGAELTIQHHDGRCQIIGSAAGTGGGADPMAFSHEWHRALIADFADAIRDGREPAVSGRSALAVHRLIDVLVTSGRERRAVAFADQN